MNLQRRDVNNLNDITSQIKKDSFDLEGLTTINYLLKHYHKTALDTDIEKALHTFYSWYELSFSKHKILDSEKVLVLCDLLDEVNRLGLCIVEDAFEKVLRIIIELFSKETEEDIEKEIALVTACITYETNFSVTLYAEKSRVAKRRLMNHLKQVISSDSSYLDPSIGTAYYLLIYLRDLSKRIEAIDNEYFLFIQGAIKNLLIYLYAFVDPNGYLVPIGNSNPIKIEFEELAKIATPFIQHLEYVTSKGLSGKPLLYQNAFFPTSNQFIAVSKDRYDTDFIKLYFQASYNSYINKHNDDLSFILFYLDLPIFLDAGMYDEKSSNFFQKGAMSPYSHNTICVDRKGYVGEDSVKKTGITDVVINDNLVFLCGQSLAYNEVYIRRNVLFINNEVLLLIDDIEAKDNHLYEICFNINRVINLKKWENCFYGYIEEKRIFSLRTIFSNITLSRKYNYGNKREFLGLICKETHELEPCHSLVIGGIGNRTVIITEITFNNASSVSSCNASNSKVEIMINGEKYLILRGRDSNSLYKNGVVLPSFRNENKTLTTAITEFYKESNSN